MTDLPGTEDPGADVAVGLALAAELGLEPLPEEGGLFRQTRVSAHQTVIYFMVIGDDFSALHRLDSPETYFFHAGAPLRMLLLGPTGSQEVVLGPRNPQHTVEAGIWQGSSSTGAWTLVSTVMSPGFSWDGFELGTRAALTVAYPEAGGRIEALTRS